MSRFGKGVIRWLPEYLAVVAVFTTASAFAQAFVWHTSQIGILASSANAAVFVGGAIGLFWERRARNKLTPSVSA